MRTTKELLQLILKQGNRFFSDCFGLCELARRMKDNNFITFREYQILHKFIYDNRPKADSPHYDKNMADRIFFWKLGVWAPRKRWLEDQIKNIEK